MVKNMKKIYAILALAGMMLAGCDGSGRNGVDDLDTFVEGEVTLSTSEIVAGPEGGSFNVGVTSSSNWRVSGMASWVSFGSTSGKSGEPLVVKVDPNSDKEARIATFKVFSDASVKLLTVTSNPVYTVVLLSDDAVSVGSDAGTVSVSLSSNATEFDYDFGGAAWISYDSMIDAFGKKIVKLAVTRSRDFKAREAKVTVRGAGAETAPVITVTQARRDTVFAVEGQAVVKGLEAMDVTLNIKSNVDFTYSLPAWLGETSSSETPPDETTGLKTRTVVLHADASMGSRANKILFRSGGATCGSVYIKQQAPNPLYAEIEDDALAAQLENDGWVLVDPLTGKVEVVEKGLGATSLHVNNSSVTKISGIDVFPALTSLSIGNQCRSLTSIALGSCKVSTVSFGSNHYFTSTSLKISGEHVTSIAVPCTSWHVQYGYDKLETLDVTGCPALATLDAKRQYNSYEGPLKTIYMTKEQAESVLVTKHPSAEIVVK